MFYQWGRKDPFPGGKSGTAGYAALSKFYGIGQTGAGSTSTVTVSSDNNADAIVESIQKPTTFYTYKNSDYGDWLPTHDNLLWSTNGLASGSKTIYDPCPSGWRVPARIVIGMSDEYSPWKGVATPSFTTGNTGGANWGTNTLFPAAGYRYYSSGSIFNEGSYGVYWSASPSSSSSNATSYLRFGYSGTIDRSGYSYRALGFSVRCAQE